jgi:hypothetical protein
MECGLKRGPEPLGYVNGVWTLRGVARLIQLQGGGNQRPPGYRPDDPRSTWNLTASDSDRNQRPLGYEPSSGSATLRQQFHPIEGAPSSVMRFSLARFATESKCEGTSTVRPLSRTRP